ncbi:MAG: putative Na+/H+ antiporter, partial [Myxococcota bacterium]|nr:putative Na+/H+ antiporter [Myxococcota bacterium]
MHPSAIEVVATVLFGLAILHTFTVKRFHNLAHRMPDGGVLENVFHMLAEVEVVFGLWAGVFLVVLAGLGSVDDAVHYLEGAYVLGGGHGEGSGQPVRIDFTEPAFVFVIMVVAATRPVLEMTGRVIERLAGLLPMSPSISFFVVALIVGPLLGSFITEPAAMTVTALLLRKRFYDLEPSTRLKYATLGLLFVNISIGGTLTHFAAPPVLMVAGPW